MRSSNTALVALAALALGTGCDAWLTKPSLYNTVEVTATRRNGELIPGVGLELYTGTRPMGYGATGPDGHYTFTRVPQGTYGVLATELPNGYELIENLVGGPPSNVVSGLAVANDTAPPVRFTFLKRGPGAIVVHVTDVSGSRLGGVPVELYAPTRSIAKANTDASGYVTFDAVPFGQYGVAVTRPLYYRDYRTPGDSAYAYRDGIVVEDGSKDSAVVKLQRCAGAVNVIALDENGAPVAGVTAALYVFTGGLGVAVTGADGRVTFVALPCAFSMGVRINPAPGYTAPEGRGTTFVDGLTVTNGATVDAVFHVQHQR